MKEYRKAATSSEEPRLRKLVELGVLTRENDKPLRPFEAIRTNSSLSQAIIEDRQDRF